MSKEAETDICGICREELTEATKIQECSHVFCFACIGKWCNISNSCPLCQTRFFQLCRIAEPNHKDKEVQAKTKTGNNVVVSVKNVDKRQENWMQVMEEYDSEEISIHTDSEEDEDDEALGSEGDRYEPDFVVPDHVIEYEDGTIVDYRGMNDENPFGATPKGQPDSIITTKDGEIITISWTNPCFNSGSVGVPKYGSSLGPVFENEDGGDEDFQYIPPTEMSMSEDVEEEEDSVFDSQDLESSDGEGVVLYRRK